MATKRPEPCPMCGHEQMPTDAGNGAHPRVFVVKDTYPVWLWRFECSKCHWVWANPLQREHNSQEFNRSHKSRHGGMYA